MHYCFLLFAEFKPIKHLQNIRIAKLYTIWPVVIRCIPARSTVLYVVILLVLFSPFSLGFTAEVVQEFDKTHIWHKCLQQQHDTCFKPNGSDGPESVFRLGKYKQARRTGGETRHHGVPDAWKDEFLTWETTRFKYTKLRCHKMRCWSWTLY